MSTPEEVASDIAALPAHLRVEIAREVTRQGLMLEADVKQLASRDRNLPSEAGKPPRLQTGDYHGSIGSRTTVKGTNIGATVGTDKAQGARLEHGYDAPGQHTLPHPHFGPALDAATPRFVAAIQKAAGRAPK